MQAVAPVTAEPAALPATPATQSPPASATEQFGLSFDSLLRIVLTQLTYQDPLKPMENFEFVSQLAQFSQIQQTQSMSDNLAALVRAQSTGQAASLLGRTVDVAAGTGSLTGKVTAVGFANGTPTFTISTSDGKTISGLPLASVTQIRETK